MGKIVSVWSSANKTGKTLFLYMLINHLSSMVDRDLKILVSCVNFNYVNLMKMFNIDNGELNFEDLVNFKLQPDNQFNLLNALAKRKNIYFLGSKRANSTYASRNIRVYESLLLEFKQTFDAIFIDTAAGTDNPLTNMIIDKSNYVLNVIDQDKEALDRGSFTTGKDMAFIINNYRDIYPDTKEITSLYKLKNVSTLPYCGLLQEMRNRGKLEFYIQHDTEYNRLLKTLAGHIAKQLNLKPGEEAAVGKKKRNIFAAMLGGLP